MKLINLKETKMNEQRIAEQEIVGIIEGGLDKYKKALKLILEMQIENLYGGGKVGPRYNEDNEEAVIEIWNEAVGECLKKVREL